MMSTYASQQPAFRGGGGGPALTAWPYTYVLPGDIAGFGSSTMSAPWPNSPLGWSGQDSTGLTNYYGPSAGVVGGYTPYGGSLPAPASGGKVIMNYGTGGNNSTQVLATVTAAPARAKAAAVVFSLGGNYETNIFPVTTIVTNAQSMAAQLTTSNFIHVPKHNDGAGIASSGGIDWYWLRALRRELQAIYPGRVSDAALFFRQGYTGMDAADLTAQSRDNVATSISGGTPPATHTDTAHLSGNPTTTYGGNPVPYSGNQLLSRYVYSPYFDALNGGLPFIPHQSVYSTDAGNQTSGGLVGTVLHDSSISGTLTGVTFDIYPANANFSVAVESGAIVVRRATSTFLGDGYYILPIRAKNSTKSRISYVRVFLINLAPTGTYRTDINAQRIVRQPIVNGVASGQKISIALGIKPKTGGVWEYNGTTITTHQLIKSNAGGGGGFDIATKAGTNMNIGTLIKNSAGTDVVNIDSQTSANFRFNEANAAFGVKWYFLSVDLSGAGVGTVTVDSNTVNVISTTTGTATGGATMVFWPVVANILQSLFATNTGSTCQCEVAGLWMAADYVDFTVQANRDLVRDATTRASVLGTTRGANGPGVVASISPMLWMEGPAGNFASGINLAAPSTLGELWDATDRAMMVSV